MARSRHATQKSPRKRLTKEMLLPLPPGSTRKMSLENHLAHATLRSNQGGSEQIFRLLKMVYLAWFMLDPGLRDQEIELFRAAETTLCSGANNAESCEPWALSDADGAVLETILHIHDQQINNVPAHVYATATKRLQDFTHCTSTLSPIPKPGDGERK